MVENLKKKKENFYVEVKTPRTTTNFNSDHMQSMLLRNPKQKVCSATVDSTSCPYLEADIGVYSLRNMEMQSHL